MSFQISFSRELRDIGAPVFDPHLLPASSSDLCPLTGSPHKTKCPVPPFLFLKSPVRFFAPLRSLGFLHDGKCVTYHWEYHRRAVPPLWSANPRAQPLPSLVSMKDSPAIVPFFGLF